jgi:molybdate transport system substrate-binding protein
VRKLLSLLFTLALGLLTAGCASSATVPASSSTVPGGGSSGAPAIQGDLTVLAAASLTEAFTAAQTTLRTRQPGLALRYSFGGSGALAEQIRAGAPADVIATADLPTMDALVAAGLVDEPQIFARNHLGILVEPGNPQGIRGLADLARGDLIVVLCDENVPAGRYADQVLAAAGVTVKPKSLEPDVKAAVNKVTRGEADATIVYVTDVAAAGATGELVAIPATDNLVASYPIAVVKTTGNRDAAEAFVRAMVSGSGQDALRAHGFLTPR